MKRFITMIVAACAFFAVSAQRPLVTLSHDGNLSFFSTLSAFEDAMEAAVDGDIIYLSEGQCTTKSDTVKINKRLSIQGCGYNSRVLCHLKVDMKEVVGEETDLPLFDGVKLRTLEFVKDSLSRNKSHNVEIRKTYIENMVNCGYAAKNMIIDRCWIESLNATGAYESNVTLQNTKVDRLEYSPAYGAYGSSSLGSAALTVINCNIKSLGFLPKIAISSILGSSLDRGSYSSSGTPSLYNTLTLEEVGSSVVKNGCYINYQFTFNDKCEVDESELNSNGWFGQDGTVVGVAGGEFPFTENPSVPTVDAGNSSVEYDAESNSLNVTITVLPN